MSADYSAESRAFQQCFAVARLDAAGRILSANMNFSKFFQIPLEQLSGRNVFDFAHGRDVERQKRIWAEGRSESKYEDVGLWCDALGSSLWLAASYVDVTERGDAPQTIMIARDVTLEQEREAEARGQMAAMNATQGLAHYSVDGLLLDANENFLVTMGYHIEELAGRPHSIFLESSNASSDQQALFWRRLADGEHIAGEFIRVAKSGEKKWLRAVYNPIRDRTGSVVKVVSYVNDVTEERLQQADYQWQINAIHKSNAVITFDMFGTILEVNDRFIDAIGYEKSAVLGQHHRIFVEPAYAHSEEYASFWNDLRKGLHRSGVYKRIARDGREIWLQATYNPIFDLYGTPIKVVKFASVVTEEKLFQSELQGQIAAIDKAQCVVALSLDGSILDANENFLSSVGYRYGEVRGRHHSMFVDEETRQSAEYREFWEQLRRGEYQQGEYKRISRNGSEIWLQASYNPIFDPNGKLSKVIKYATDITEEKRQQVEINGQMDAINRSQAVAMFDMNGVILHANENLLDIFGYRASDILGKSHSVLMDAQEALSKEYGDFWDGLRRGDYQQGLHRRVGKDGREIWLQCSYNPILDINGAPLKVVKIATDVTMNVALAEAFEDAKRQALHDTATSLPPQGEAVDLSRCASRRSLRQPRNLLYRP
ncbi:PAS domain-containing protein [Rhizobium sp. G21]|uniref:PAS domain-containing protein n=1 Tax=Rhizobium sp. G21 TaxID=2758439 RepID=UPI0016001FC2|nr:PAS domain-containing protein [Rhizobium sp. G21]MBB1251473.1 PAS domain S-box protein [Rhizobium sp. G21]